MVKPAKRIDFAATDTRARSLESPVKRVTRAFLWTVIVFLFGILGLGFLGSLFAPCGRSASKNKIEVKQAADLMSGFAGIADDQAKQRRLRKLGDVRGEKFYEAAFKARLLDDTLLGKLVSKNSTTDSTADKIWIDTAEPLPEHSCSFTAPRADMLLEVLKLKGEQRCVVFCFNSRNWRNYPDHGVLVHFSDADIAEYMTFEDAHDNWGITEEEWDDPAGRLFGKKAPFQHTYE
jgi:hypothetical protein